jgi:hypothetical protein
MVPLAVASGKTNESAVTRMLQALTNPLSGPADASTSTWVPSDSGQAVKGWKTDNLSWTLPAGTPATATVFAASAQKSEIPVSTLPGSTAVPFTADIARPVSSPSLPSRAQIDRSIAWTRADMTRSFNLAPLPGVDVSEATPPAPTSELQQTPIAVPATPLAGSMALEGQTKQNGPIIVHNQYGQIITIQQTGEPDDEPLATGAPALSTPSIPESTNLDITNQYIRSHLPKDTVPKDSHLGEKQHVDGSGTTAQPEVIKAVDADAGGHISTEPLPLAKTQPGIGQESQPLLFAHQRTSNPMHSAALSTEPSLSYRLPSGVNVPEGSVVDQMIAHFSVNKRLETGTVNLRLYPQELGELRMEIRVEQENIKAHIVAQNPQAQEMIDRHLPRLREALEQQGLHLQQIDVTVAANDHAGNEQFRDGSGWRQPGRSRGTGTKSTIFPLESETEVDTERSVANTLSVLA